VVTGGGAGDMTTETPSSEMPKYSSTPRDAKAEKADSTRLSDWSKTLNPRPERHEKTEEIELETFQTEVVIEHLPSPRPQTPVESEKPKPPKSARPTTPLTRHVRYIETRAC